MSLDVPGLEVILKEHHLAESVIKIDSIEITNALGKGENYLSSIQRVKAQVTLGSGRRKKMSLIVKNEHVSPVLKQMSFAGGYFVREIGMYRDILPKMEDMMQEIDDYEEPLWGKCYDVRPFDKIILEDLNNRGYVMAERKEQLNFKTAKIVLRCLAKFHAMGAVLNERLQIPCDLYSRHPWSKTLNESGAAFKGSLVNLTKEMDKWGEDWKDAKNKLANGISSYWARLENYMNSTYDGFKVLLHGDCWTNNMLFKYGADSDTPISMKFIDMQVCFVGTPSHDLHWFFVSSVPLESRTVEPVQELLQAYTSSLDANLKKFGYSGNIPTPQDILDDFNKTKYLSLWFSALLAAPVLNDADDALDIEDLMTKSEQARQEGDTENIIGNIFSALSPAGKALMKHEIHEADVNNLLTE